MRIIFILFLLFKNLHVKAQMKGQFEDGNRVLSPKEIVSKLKSGVLIVRLITKQNTIDYLMKNGKPELANKIKLEQSTTNKSIIKSFNTYFNFCPVYFIKSSQSELVMKKEFNKVEFVDSSLTVNKTITFRGGFILTAEIKNVEQKKAYHGKEYFLDSITNSRGQYKKGTSVTFGALVVKDDQFEQLRRPFPYYVRSFESIGFLRRSPNTMVQMFQNNIKYLAN